MVPGDLCDSEDDDSSTCSPAFTGYCVEDYQDCTHGGAGGRAKESGALYSTVPNAKTPTYVEAVLTKVVTQDTKSTLYLLISYYEIMRDHAMCTRNH